MFLQAVPPPIPPPPPPGLSLENEMILLLIGVIYGMVVLYKTQLTTKKNKSLFIDKRIQVLRTLNILFK